MPKLQLDLRLLETFRLFRPPATCYDCSLWDGEERPAEIQLCGRWLCRRHRLYWEEKGASVLRAVQRALHPGVVT